jgi:hypothetical protein
MDLMTEVPIPITVPVMVMVKSPAVSFPVTHKKRLPIVTGGYPARTQVWWSSPVAFMPSVTVLHHIPITVYPYELGGGPGRCYVNHAGRRWRTDSDSNGDLSGEYKFAGQ